MKDATGTLDKDNHFISGLLQALAPPLLQADKRTSFAACLHCRRYAGTRANMSRVKTTYTRTAQSIFCAGWLSPTTVCIL
jgi:hypothetical protein